MSVADLHAHLATGETHVCQCWSIARADGVTFGFTDHDRSLTFEGIDFMADSGMSAKALASSTGLSVNNTDAVGLLQADVITEDDIIAGRFDGAEVTNWLVQWDNPNAREVKFRGSIGEITRQNGSFEVELRGLTEALNQPQGRSFLKGCSAVLGDAACGFDLDDPSYRAEVVVQNIAEGTTYRFALSGFNEGWFTHGKLTVLDGAAVGLSAAIKQDLIVNGWREVTLWAPIGAGVGVGDQVRLDAGCDKRPVTCTRKFTNFLNFQGFPHIPGDDWLMSVPRADGAADGGSMN